MVDKVILEPLISGNISSMWWIHLSCELRQLHLLLGWPESEKHHIQRLNHKIVAFWLNQSMFLILNHITYPECSVSHMLNFFKWDSMWFWIFCVFRWHCGGCRFCMRCRFPWSCGWSLIRFGLIPARIIWSSRCWCGRHWSPRWSRCWQRDLAHGRCSA